jgi:integrase/recombinase XerD
MISTQLFHEFYTYLLTQKRVATNTYAAYQSDIDQFKNFLLSQKKELSQISVQELKDFLAHLKSINISARSMARKISALKNFWAYVHEYHALPNHAQELITPSIEKKLPHYLSEPEVEHLLAIADEDSTPLGKRNKIILYLLYATGMRISELVHLKLSTIHFDTGFIAVKGKGGKERMIPVPAPMVVLLREYVTTVHPRLIAKGGTTEYLFPIKYKAVMRPITRQSCWIILKNLWKKTGNTKSISPHQLRHSLATHMLQRGADLRSLQLLLGHEDLATVQVYTHVETSHMRSIYDKKHPRS